MVVLVAGAGSTGLLVAQGLKKAGIDFIIFERDDRNRYFKNGREWGMSMHWGGEFLVRTLPVELHNRLQDIECDPFYDSSSDTGFVQCNGKTGQVILNMPGKSPKRVSRQKLRNFLARDLDIKFGKTLHDVQSSATGVVVTFTDNSTKEGSVLLGCDGSKSRVRQLLCGQEASQLSNAGITMINFPYNSYSAEQARHLRMIHPIFKVAYHPEVNGMYLLCIGKTSDQKLAVLDNPDPDRPETWTYQHLMSWKGPPSPNELQEPAARMRIFKERAKDYAEPWRTAALAVADETLLPIDSGQYLLPDRWYHAKETKISNVTLAGDAAHPMLPHRGQGLNHALQDASKFVEAMDLAQRAGTLLQEVISSYEEEMLRRTGLEVHTSLQQAEMAHDWSKLAQSPMFKIGANKG